MRERLVQKHFSGISPEWEKPPEVLIEEAGRQIYERSCRGDLVALEVDF